MSEGAHPGLAAAPVTALWAGLAERYTLQRELGHGGMATVYLAHDLKHDRDVALKVLRPELAATLGPLRFLREITLTAQLNHPHILPLLDSGTIVEGSGGAELRRYPFYVMPYVEGESLRDRLNREKQLPLEDALQIAREVGDALSYAHTHHVIHRDIKPENILLESGHAVVADFGIARAISAAGGEKLTETGLAVGTPAYMSPEQAAGERELDGRSDEYALGCVLYEMLAGQPPFTGTTAESIVRQHIAAPAPNITVIRPAVPTGIGVALQRAMAKAPADRFQTPAAFMAALTTPGTGATQPAGQGTGRSWRRIALLGFATAVVIAGAVVVGRRVRPGPGGPRYPRTAIAVLPFQNLSAMGPHSYFAGGLHDELLTQLAKVATLKVIGRTSVFTYEGSRKRLSEIGDELAVGSVVEGSMQVVGDRLRVNVHLIDPITEAPLWAEQYDRTLDDAFAVQSEIAQQIVQAVGATLGGTERTAITEAPTANAEAYRLYLQGQEYYRRPGYAQPNWEIAQDFYERALALDSTFALAHAALSELHGRISWHRRDPSPERRVRARMEAETALRLAPNLPEAHRAMGLVHHFGRDWQGALTEYYIALEGLPNDAWLWMLIGGTNRRIGNWDESLRALDKVVALDPRSADNLRDLGGYTLLFLHSYQKAVDWFSRSVALAPDVAGTDVVRGWTWVVWHGRLDSLRAALDRHAPEADLDDEGSASAWRARLLFWERKPDSVLALLRGTPLRVFDGADFYLPTALYAAWAQQLRGDGVAAGAAFDSARALLDSVVAVIPDDWRVHAARGLALAGLGRRQEALREARWLEQSPVYRKDALSGPRLGEDRARILAGTGESAAALTEIERLLAGPSSLSVHTLRLDPGWDPIRNDPRFRALLVKYAAAESP